MPSGRWHVSKVPKGELMSGKKSWLAAALDDLKRFKLHWKERGGPTVREPSRKSFGSRLIEQALPGQLHGEARLLFEPDGVSCEVNIPLSVMQEPIVAAPTSS